MGWLQCEHLWKEQCLIDAAQRSETTLCWQRVRDRRNDQSLSEAAEQNWEEQFRVGNQITSSFYAAVSLVNDPSRFLQRALGKSFTPELFVKGPEERSLAEELYKYSYNTARGNTLATRNRFIGHFQAEQLENVNRLFQYSFKQMAEAEVSARTFLNAQSASVAPPNTALSAHRAPKPDECVALADPDENRALLLKNRARWSALVQLCN